jgi:plasmid stabilization system protein ParE
VSIFQLIVTEQAALEGFAAKRWVLDHLGAAHAQELVEAIASAFDRIQRFPRSGAREKYRGHWSNTRRKTRAGNTAYLIRYRVNLRAELVEVFSIRHQKRRPPR